MRIKVSDLQEAAKADTNISRLLQRLTESGWPIINPSLHGPKYRYIPEKLLQSLPKPSLEAIRSLEYALPGEADAKQQRQQTDRSAQEWQQHCYTQPKWRLDGRAMAVEVTEKRVSPPAASVPPTQSAFTAGNRSVLVDDGSDDEGTGSATPPAPVVHPAGAISECRLLL